MCSLLEASNRYDQLIALRDKLATSIDTCESMRDLASLSRQYRETIREIEELERGTDTDDEIGELLRQREADGEPGAVRPSRAGL